MAEERYQAAEAPDAPVATVYNCFQVSTLGGDAKQLRVEHGKLWKDFKNLLKAEFDIPPALQKLIQVDHILEFDDMDCIMDLVAKSKLLEDDMMTVARLAEAWLWVDATGKNPSRSYSDHQDSYKVLTKILDWLDDAHGEDTCAEEMGVGVVYVCGGDVPQNSDDLLKFLSGSEGVEGHDPVTPEYMQDGDDDDDGEVIGLPWNDIVELGAITISDVWPPRRAITNYYGRVARPPPADEVTRALVCADEGASEDDVEQLASKCFFFGVLSVPQRNAEIGKLKPEAEMQSGSYFHSKCPADPHVFVCANPVKQTIAFCYQTAYLD